MKSTFQNVGNSVFKAFGDLMQSVTLTDTQANTYSAEATMVDARTMGFPDVVSANFQNGCLIQGFGLAVPPRKNWMLTDAAGKKWRIEDVLSDTAGALHQCLLSGGGS